MKAKKVVSFLSSLGNKLEPEYSLVLDDIIFSKVHGHEICVMQLVGKNAFPKFAPAELLADPSALVGLSAKDAIIIAQLDHRIKERQKKTHVLEVDRNGTVLLKLPNGKIERFSEKHVSATREMLKDLDSLDSHDIGYRVGFGEGLKIKNKKNCASIKNKIVQFIPFLKK